MRRSPGSTLFPYTTLFRSRRRVRYGGERLGLLQRPGRASRARRGQARRASGTLQDRKSTRLNSSHSSISYAVFCLKKKNITQDVFVVEMVVIASIVDLVV